MKLNKGDKVLIKDLIDGKWYGNIPALIRGHVPFSNKIVTVARVDTTGNECFYLTEDKYDFAFSVEMVEKNLSSLYNKLQIVKELFASNIKDENNQFIDNEKVLDYTRAFYIAKQYITNAKDPSKDDLLYINKTIKKLVDILGKDKDKIVDKYVAAKLKIKEDKFFPYSAWLTAYEDLLKIL